MTVDDFREIALSLPGAEESSHLGAADFRVGGRIFATLAMQDQGYGNLMLTVELQQSLIAASPDVFLPVHGGWGRMGATHIRLGISTETQLSEALRIAWNLRTEKNAKAKSPSKRITKSPPKKTK